EDRAEGFARSRLVRQRPVSRAVGIGEPLGIDDVRVAVYDVDVVHAVLGMALVVAGSKRCRACGSTAIEAPPPERRPVSRPMRAMMRGREWRIVSISSVAARSGWTAPPRVSIGCVRVAIPGGGAS